MFVRKPTSLWLGLLAAALTLCGGFGSSQAAEAEIVKFRLTKWKASHLDDAAAAEKLGGTLEQLGCEVQVHSHDDHHDVRYRCAQWRSISLKSHDEAHQWERWLKAKGFETSHEH